MAEPKKPKNYEKKLLQYTLIVYRNFFTGTTGPLAERHQILYPGFSKPGYHYNGSAVSDHGKLYPE
ncbi:protein of unknown function [Chryseobacterium sp. JV274]|nr:protein of unknown function [Chryseobacterium sp. JV274]